MAFDKSLPTLSHCHHGPATIGFTAEDSVSPSRHAESAPARRRHSSTRPSPSSALTLRPHAKGAACGVRQQHPRWDVRHDPQQYGDWVSVITRYFIGLDNRDLFSDVLVSEKVLEFEASSTKASTTRSRRPSLQWQEPVVRRGPERDCLGQARRGVEAAWT